MFTPNTHETSTRSWSCSSSPETTAARVKEVLSGCGGRVSGTGAGVEASFGSRAAMRLGGVFLAKKKAPYSVWVECAASGAGGTVVSAHATDTTGGLFRLAALRPLYEQRFAEVFDQLEQAT